MGRTRESLAHSRSGIWCGEVGGPGISSEGPGRPLGFRFWRVRHPVPGELARVLSWVVLELTSSLQSLRDPKATALSCPVGARSAQAGDVSAPSSQNVVGVL